MYLKDLRNNNTQELGEPLKVTVDISLFDGHLSYHITLAAGHDLVVNADQWSSLIEMVREARWAARFCEDGDKSNCH